LKSKTGEGVLLKNAILIMHMSSDASSIGEVIYCIVANCFPKDEKHFFQRDVTVVLGTDEERQ
jgi:hypothetical protein